MPIIFFTKQQVGFVRRTTYCENLVCQFLRTDIYIYIFQIRNIQGYKESLRGLKAEMTALKSMTVTENLFNYFTSRKLFSS